MTSESRPPIELTVSQFELVSGRPIVLNDQGKLEATADQRELIDRIGPLVKGYLEAGHSLIANEYRSVRSLAPSHLTQASKAFVLICDDGIMIRYENSEDDKDHVLVGFMHEPLQTASPKISESVLYCVTGDSDDAEVPATGGVVLNLVKGQADGSQEKFAEFRIAYKCRLPEPETDPETAFGKPFRLFGVRSEVEIQMLAEAIEIDNPANEARQFVLRAPMSLPVGWNYIEVYPRVRTDNWDPRFAKSWAENDILTWVMRAQMMNDHFRSLDPNVDSRKQWAKLISDYEALLDSNPREESLQEFLKNNPILLCPVYGSVWPKVPFGGKVSDFVFREAAGDYLLVELELSSAPLFIKSGDTSGELKHAQNQILDWRRYIEDNLPTVQRELKLEQLTSSPKSLIVIGRSNTLSAEDRRKLQTIENQSPREKIMTYDDVLTNAKAAIENIVGPLWMVQGSAEVYILPKRDPPSDGRVTPQTPS
jgi:hypothetical protein